MNAISFRRGYRMHYQSNVLSPAQFAMPDEARLRWERNYVAGFTERLADITIEFWRDVPWEYVRSEIPSWMRVLYLGENSYKL